MNHIQKSLLASAARKIIPFQMMKTNYGFSSADANDIENAGSIAQAQSLTADEVAVLGLQIQNLPLDASFVAIALRVPRTEEVTQELQVSYLASAPVGEDKIRIPIQPGQQYYIYMLSNRYKDGYITTDNQLVEAAAILPGDDEAIGTDNRRLFETNGPTDEIIIEQLTLEETSPEDEWYPYDGQYERPDLLWADPTPIFTIAEGIAPQSSYSYLAYQRTWVQQVQNDYLEAFGVQGPVGDETLRASYQASRFPIYNPITRTNFNVTNWDYASTLKAIKGRTMASLTYDQWKDDPRLTASDAAMEVLADFESKGGKEQYLYRLIGGTPSTEGPDDEVPEYDMTYAFHNQLAGQLVLMEYIIRPYGRSEFGQVFKEDFKDGSDARAGVGSIRSPAQRQQARDFRTLAENVRNNLEDAEARGLRETDKPVLFEDGNAIYESIKTVLYGRGGQDTYTDDAELERGRNLIKIVEDWTTKYKGPKGIGGRGGQNYYGSYYFDPFEDYLTELTYFYDMNKILGLGKEIYGRFYWEWQHDTLEETDRMIAMLGDLTFFPPPDPDDNQPQLAHEATLQNIRFLRNMLEETRDDLWSQGTSLNSFIVNTLVQLRTSILGNLSRTNSITNLTSTNQVAPSQLEVLIRDITKQDSKWMSFQGSIIEMGNGIMALDVSHLKDPGQYIISVRPQGIEIGIPRLSPFGAGIVNTPDLNDYQSKNYFYGWNIEFRQAGDNGVTLGEQRMIVGSKFQVNNHMLLISPTIDSRPDFQENILAYIWPNTFIPVMIDLELTEHNAETLSYANYAKREFNTKTGVLTLYRYDGSVYKQWTIGERTLESEGYADIDFRDPIEDN